MSLLRSYFSHCGSSLRSFALCVIKETYPNIFLSSRNLCIYLLKRTALIFHPPQPKEDILKSVIFLFEYFKFCPLQRIFPIMVNNKVYIVWSFWFFHNYFIFTGFRLPQAVLGHVFPHWLKPGFSTGN